MPVLYFRCKLGAKGARKFPHLCMVPVAQSAVEVIETIRGTFASAFLFLERAARFASRKSRRSFASHHRTGHCFSNRDSRPPSALALLGIASPVFFAGPVLRKIQKVPTLIEFDKRAGERNRFAVALDVPTPRWFVRGGIEAHRFAVHAKSPAEKDRGDRDCQSD
jgi:hypothetical protein